MAIIGNEFTFRQYMCSNCRKMFFIEEKKDTTSEESFAEMNKTYQSPCCKPYFHKYRKKDIYPHGVYIRTLTLKVTDIPDEIALVHKRRVADEKGEKDPYGGGDE